jgi:DNA polymerase III alpha subunit
MKTNCHGQMIFDEADLVNQLMQGNQQFAGYTVDSSVNLSAAVDILENTPSFINYNNDVENISTEQFDLQCQQNWHMPEKYKTLDIAELVLSQCNNDNELQRCGQELLLYQERNLFDLLRYLKYLVDTMNQNQVIWGVGRGSSVASYVLYKLKVHRIDSLYYNLDITEFLR